MLERWLNAHPRDYELWLWLGDLRQHDGMPEPALEAWGLAARAPGRLKLTALFRIGAAHLQAADAPDARETFRAAVACAPDCADAYCGLAAAAAQLGDFETLEREAMRSIDLDPHCYTAWYQLTLAPDIAPQWREKMHRVAKEAGDNPAAWLLHIALGRVLERSGDYDHAFTAYSRGQLLRGRAYSIDFSRQDRYFASVCRRIDAAFVRRIPPAEVTGVRPIFIVGMPRSGTTLVESILGAHPEVATGGEMRFVHDWLRRHAGSAATAAAVEWLARIDDHTLAGLIREWSKMLDKARGAHGRVTDKFPLNFSIVGLIALCFPDAAIVHVRRDPRDICVSCYTTALYGDAVPATLGDLGACYRGYELLMRHWENLLGKDRIVEVEYEALVERPEPTIRNLLAAVKLDWDASCVAFHESKRPVATASLYQVRQPIYRNSVGRWRRFERHLKPLFEALGGSAAQ